MSLRGATEVAVSLRGATEAAVSLRGATEAAVSLRGASPWRGGRACRRAGSGGGPSRDVSCHCTSSASCTL